MIYDNNQIQSDGPVCLTNSENINQKIAASNWHVIDVENGSYDVAGILKALVEAKTMKGKPTFINVRTVIGIDTRVANNRKAHGTPLGDEEVRKLKVRYGLDSDVKFHVPQLVRDFFAVVPSRGEQQYQEWQQLLLQYGKAYPELSAEFHKRLSGEMPPDISSFTERRAASSRAIATRESAEYAIHPSFINSPTFIVGTADLDSSVKLAWEGKRDFQCVCPTPTPNHWPHR